MPPPQISIIGGGIAGLVLSRCLRYHGISSIIYEKDSAQAGLARYGYGITLWREAFSPLLQYLDVDERSLKKRVAVDAAIDGTGRLGGKQGALRANRNRFEAMLREGLEVRWEHHLTCIKSEGRNQHTLDFRNRQQTTASIVIGAEGPHSPLRKHLSPSTDFKVLPYAVYNGKRRLNRRDYDRQFAFDFQHNTVIEQRHGDVLLQISLNDISDEEASLSYTYSRPSHQSCDPIFNPARPNAGAKEIPEALFDEVSRLGDLEGPFKEIFNPEAMRKDRTLNWLMRTIAPSSTLQQDLAAAAEKGIVLMGDAVHATPILGGNGANEAIRDGIELGEFIAENGIDGLSRFYEGRWERWRQAVEESERRIEDMHGSWTEEAKL